MAIKSQANTIAIQVVYATPEKQVVVDLAVAERTTIAAAITLSGLLAEFPEIDLDKNDVGIYSERRTLADFVAAGDRVEIYRPLTLDPREIRRQRARAVKAKK